MRTLGNVGAAALAVLLALGMLMPASAQTAPPAQFRVSWAPRGGGGVPTIEGYVHNDSPYRVTNVHVDVAAVDGNGQLMARRDAWALGDIPPRGDSSFVIERFEGAADYRMTVVSYDVVSAPNVNQGAREPVQAP
jgi:hypothetical protein